MLTPTATASTQSSQISRTTQNDLGNKDIFLKLLVAQMKNQDPLKPQDATQMSSQLAQFNMVDNQRATNTKLDEMLALQGTLTSQGTAANYLGHEVVYASDSMAYTGGGSNIMVQLGKATSATEVLVKDDSGAVIRHINAGALGTGENFVRWDGKSDNGTVMPQGNYSLAVNATDTAGDPMKAAAISPMGIVSAIRTSGQSMSLIINGKTVPLDSISYIKA